MPRFHRILKKDGTVTRQQFTVVEETARDIEEALPKPPPPPPGPMKKLLNLLVSKGVMTRAEADNVETP